VSTFTVNKNIQVMSREISFLGNVMVGESYESSGSIIGHTLSIRQTHQHPLVLCINTLSLLVLWPLPFSPILSPL
jgi:hypothetical protein